MVTAVAGLFFALLSGSWGQRLLGIFLFVVPGSLAAGLIWRYRRDEFLILDREGITHPDIGTIPWDEVTAVEVGIGATGRQVTVDVRNRDVYRHRNRYALMRGLMKVDGVARTPLLTIPEQLLPIAETLRSEIEARRQAK